MPTQIKNIFSDTACPSQETMFRYVDNLLKGEEKHAFERHLAGCSFCSDAFEGLSMMSKSEAEEDVAALHSLIDNQSVRTRGGYWAWAVAASVSMLLIAGSWAYLQKDREANVAVETKTVIPETIPAEPKPSVATSESSVDSLVVEPADKTIAINNDLLEEKNISSDAGTIAPAPKIAQEVFPKPEPAPVETPAPQLSYNNEKTKTASPSTSAGYSGDMARKEETVEQKKSIKDDDQSVSSSPGITLQMLAFEENIINGNQEEQKQNISTTSTISNKAANSPSRAANPAPKPYLKEEAVKKPKAASGCKNCPDKEISQGATQDMQELTYDYAVKKFNEKSYEEAHLKFDQFIKGNPDLYQAGNARIYDAICLIYQNKPDEALARLNELNGNKEFADDAKWLKAAIYIDQDKTKEAADMLKELEKNKIYKEKAARAMESLR